MSKDYRFKKEDYEAVESVASHKHVDAKSEEAKAELARKKRASKQLAETRSKMPADSKSED
jgi:hypothetical protein